MGDISVRGFMMTSSFFFMSEKVKKRLLLWTKFLPILEQEE